MTTSNEKMLEEFRAFTNDERAMVQAAALMFEPFQTTQMVDVLQKFFKRNLDNVAIRDTQKKLVKKGFLTVKGHHYRGDKKFSNYLLDTEFRQNDDYTELAVVIQKVLASMYWYGSTGDLGQRAMRDVRIAYYSGNYTAFVGQFLSSHWFAQQKIQPRVRSRIFHARAF